MVELQKLCDKVSCWISDLIYSRLSSWMPSLKLLANPPQKIRHKAEAMIAPLVTTTKGAGGVGKLAPPPGQPDGNGADPGLGGDAGEV